MSAQGFAQFLFTKLKEQVAPVENSLLNGLHKENLVANHQAVGTRMTIVAILDGMGRLLNEYMNKDNATPVSSPAVDGGE